MTKREAVLAYIRLRSAASQRGISMQDIATGVRLARSTVFQHVRNLVRDGVVTQGATPSCARSGRHARNSIRAVPTGIGPDLRELPTIYHNEEGS